MVDTHRHPRSPLKTLVHLRWVHVALDDVQDGDVDLGRCAAWIPGMSRYVSVCGDENAKSLKAKKAAKPRPFVLNKKP